MILVRSGPRRSVQVAASRLRHRMERLGAFGVAVVMEPKGLTVERVGEAYDWSQRDKDLDLALEIEASNMRALEGFIRLSTTGLAVRKP